MRASFTWLRKNGRSRVALAVAWALLSCCDDGGTNQIEDAGAEPVLDAEPLPVRAEDAAAPASPVRVDRGHLANVGSEPLDYADPALWMCRPRNDPNECLENLDSTELLKDGSQQTEQHVPAAAPAFDCFYSYPTVDVSGVGNVTDFVHIDLVLETLRAQAARFSRICEVYAPLYRQRSFNSMNQLTGDAELAYGDVESAFLHYLEHDNRGRDFVLIGHSQGSGILTRVAAEHIDNDPALRARLISAVLIGASIAAPEGRDVGGSFQNLPFCTRPAQTGCVISFVSFAQDVPPNLDRPMGLGRAPAGSVHACTNPSLLAGNDGRYRGSYLPVRASSPLFVPNLPANMSPAVETETLLVRDLFAGECVHRDGVSYLEIAPDQSWDDERPVPPHRYALQEALGIGMHTGDFSVVLDDLIDAVKQQAEAM